MTDTALAAHAAALALPAPAIKATRRYLQAQVAPATLRAYQSDFAVFAAWCASAAGGRGAAAFPAAFEVVAVFLAAQADAGVKVATIRRRAAAIHFRHVSAQVESPTRSMLVTAALKGIRRELGVVPAKKAPAADRRRSGRTGGRPRPWPHAPCAPRPAPHRAVNAASIQAAVTRAAASRRCAHRRVRPGSTLCQVTPGTGPARFRADCFAGQRVRAQNLAR